MRRCWDLTPNLPVLTAFQNACNSTISVLCLHEVSYTSSEVSPPNQTKSPSLLSSAFRALVTYVIAAIDTSHQTIPSNNTVHVESECWDYLNRHSCNTVTWCVFDIEDWLHFLLSVNQCLVMESKHFLIITAMHKCYLQLWQAVYEIVLCHVHLLVQLYSALSHWSWSDQTSECLMSQGLFSTTLKYTNIRVCLMIASFTAEDRVQHPRS